MKIDAVNIMLLSRQCYEYGFEEDCSQCCPSLVNIIRLHIVTQMLSSYHPRLGLAVLDHVP